MPAIAQELPTTDPLTSPASDAAKGPDRRLVVSLPSDERRLRLPASTMSQERWISGGVRMMHELAFAAAQAGWEVELRGWIHRPLYE